MVDCKPTPIKAHQPTTFALLRRPRPPKALTNPAQPSNRGDGSTKNRISPQKSSKSKQSSPLFLESFQPSDIHTNAKTDFPIYPLYPKGPDFFPPGKKLVSHLGDFQMPLFEDSPSPESFCGPENDPLDSDCYPESDDELTLANFQMSAGVSPQCRLLYEKGAKVISRENYLKLTGWFAVNVPTQQNINTVDLDVGLQSPEERKPRHQALIELRSMINDALMGTTSAVSVESVESEPRLAMEPPDLVINASLSRYFCGQGRSNSPFKSIDQPEISPSEVAILQCMMTGGRRLDLKAHFISQLPDLSPLTGTLTYLNLSFNCINAFPAEVLQLPHLVCLLMRNNPIKEIPSEIRCLRKLRVLCVSFNLLSDLPAGLFDLHSLRELDVSYNSLHSLSRNISMLVKLRKLNVEGNQLAGLPSTSLTLPLRHLLVGDNLMHPILWRENTRNQPQELADVCAMVVRQYVTATDDPRLPEAVIDILQRHSGLVCDHCQRSLYGCGLRVIRAVSEDVLGIKNLPFVFLVCSPSCRALLRRKAHSEWSEPFNPHTNFKHVIDY